MQAIAQVLRFFIKGILFARSRRCSWRSVARLTELSARRTCHVPREILQIWSGCFKPADLARALGVLRFDHHAPGARTKHAFQRGTPRRRSDAPNPKVWSGRVKVANKGT